MAVELTLRLRLSGDYAYGVDALVEDIQYEFTHEIEDIEIVDIAEEV